jgi:hypothetical protein
MNPDPFSKVTIKLSEKNFVIAINIITNLKVQIDLDELCVKAIC